MSDSTSAPPRAYLKLVDGSVLPVVEIRVDSDVERVRSLTAQMPDERWSATDVHGHEHRYMRDDEGVPRLPSLDRRSRRVECDGGCGNWDCEGYDITEWFCRECGEQVEPGFKPDYEAMEQGIPIYQTNSYQLTVEVERARGTIEGATYVEGEFEKAFPLLHNTRFDIESSFNDRRMTGVYVAEEMRNVKRKPVGP